jgi:hypothetical protein
MSLEDEWFVKPNSNLRRLTGKSNKKSNIYIYHRKYRIAYEEKILQSTSMKTNEFIIIISFWTITTAAIELTSTIKDDGKKHRTAEP